MRVLPLALLLVVGAVSAAAEMSHQIVVETEVDLKPKEFDEEKEKMNINKEDEIEETPKEKKKMNPIEKRIAEDSIPIIEVKGEGKPMTAAQIRALEEEAEGKPLDIKIKHTWRPAKCPRAAKRKDFVTFHYKGYLEDNRKFDQTYQRGPVRIQLGVGMIMPGLEKGLRGMCDSELRKITVPHRLSRKRKSRTWKYIPNEEHWIIFDVEMLTVEAWTYELQFQFMDLNNDTFLTTNELVKLEEKMTKDFGKHLHSEDIDSTMLARYFVKYFDADDNNKVSMEEFSAKLKEDQLKMGNADKAKKPKGHKRDPGLEWVLDFNNDGIVTMDELDSAPDWLHAGPEKVAEKVARDEL